MTRRNFVCPEAGLRQPCFFTLDFLLSWRVHINITLRTKAFHLDTALFFAKTVVINVKTMKPDIGHSVHMNAVISIVKNLKITHVHVGHMRAADAVSPWTGVKAAAVFTGLNQSYIGHPAKINIMKIVFQGVAVVMELQVCGRYMFRAFNVDPIATVFNFNVLQRDIAAAGFFIRCRITTAVKNSPIWSFLKS